MKKNNFILLLSLFVIVISCSPSVKILGSWSSPSKPAEGYKSVFVTALTENLLARNAVEKDLVELIQSKGITASSSFEVIPPGFKAKEADRDAIVAKIKELGNESILTIALLDQTNETRYVPGTTMYAPMGYGYHGRFWGYYNYYNPVMYDPGYYTTDKNYYLEANLYDAATEELVWSSQSETTNPSSLEIFSKTFAQAIVQQMRKDGFISEK